MHSVPFDFVENLPIIVIAFLCWLERLGQDSIPLLKKLQCLQLKLYVFLDHHPLEDLKVVSSPNLYNY